MHDGLIKVLRGAGIEVVTDESEGLRVLDAVNGSVRKKYTKKFCGATSMK